MFACLHNRKAYLFFGATAYKGGTSKHQKTKKEKSALGTTIQRYNYQSHHIDSFKMTAKDIIFYENNQHIITKKANNKQQLPRRPKNYPPLPSWSLQ
jgi:hypothetical protein